MIVSDGLHGPLLGIFCRFQVEPGKALSYRLPDEIERRKRLEEILDIKSRTRRR
jgi:hypothetical protein